MKYDWFYSVKCIVCGCSFMYFGVTFYFNELLGGQVYPILPRDAHSMLHLAWIWGEKFNTEVFAKYVYFSNFLDDIASIESILSACKHCTVKSFCASYGLGY